MQCIPKIILDYASKGSLRSYIEEKIELQIKNGKPEYIDHRMIKRILAQVTFGMCEANNCPAGKVMHKDIKPANILLDHNEQVKICDFGISKVYDKTESVKEKMAGTRLYIAQEKLKNEGNITSDVFSLGVVGYELLTLTKPFSDECDIKNGEAPAEISKDRRKHYDAKLIECVLVCL